MSTGTSLPAAPRANPTTPSTQPTWYPAQSRRRVRCSSSATARLYAAVSDVHSTLSPAPGAVHLHVGHGRAQRLAQERRVLLRSGHQHDAARLDARHERLHRAPRPRGPRSRSSARARRCTGTLDSILEGTSSGRRRRGGVWPSAARRRARAPRRPRPPSRRHPPARWRRRRRRRLSSTAPRRARRRRCPPPRRSRPRPGPRPRPGTWAHPASAGTRTRRSGTAAAQLRGARARASRFARRRAATRRPGGRRGLLRLGRAASSTSIFSSVSLVFPSSSPLPLRSGSRAPACSGARPCASGATPRARRRPGARAATRPPRAASARRRLLGERVRTRRARLCARRGPRARPGS